MLSVLVLARARSATLLGAALAAAGLIFLAAGFGAQLPADRLMLAVLAAVVGAALIAAGSQSSRWALYAGIVARVGRGPRSEWGLRAAVVLSAPLGGAGVIAYMLAALYGTLRSSPAAAAPLDWRRTAGTGMLGLAVVLAASAAGLTVGGDTALWAILLSCSGLALFWGAAGTRRVPIGDDLVDHTLLRTGLGLVLAIGGAVLVLTLTLRFHHVGATIAATATSLAVLALVVGPWWLRTRRLLAAERTERARAQERAELADHLHDSVLQTLAPIQRRAQDPGAVAALARGQERDLRDWLLGRRASLDAVNLTDALRAVCAEVEDAYGARFELVTVGDAPVDARLQALLAATREALVNAALHAPGAPVSAFMRVHDDAVTVYVHDRGPGFDPGSVPSERRGIRESIVGRMRRHGGDAEVRSAPGAGCEVILTIGPR
jgi:signal transduction histidine kinase